jgi:hypothetical protein
MKIGGSSGSSGSGGNKYNGSDTKVGGTPTTINYAKEAVPKEGRTAKISATKASMLPTCCQHDSK